jgi:O-antigen ligase
MVLSDESAIEHRNSILNKSLWVIFTIALIACGWASVAGQSTAIMFLLGIAILACFANQILKWQNLLILNAVIVILVPARLYKTIFSASIDIDPFRMVLLLTIFLWLTHILITRDAGIKKTPINVFMFSFIVVAFLSLAVNYSSIAGRGELALAFKTIFMVASYMAVFLVFYNLTSQELNNDQALKVIKAIVFSALIAAVLALFERYTGFNVFKHLHEIFPFIKPSMGADYFDKMYRGDLRVTGSTAHPIAFGVMMSLVLPFMYYLFKRSKDKKQQIFYLISMLTTAAASIATVSRTSMLTVIIVLIVFMIALPEDRRGIFKSLLVLAAIAALSMPKALVEIFSYLTPSYFQAHEVGNRYGRFEDYPVLFREFTNSPFFGRGLGTYDPVRYRYVDNQHLLMIVELGALGLYTFWGIFYRAYRHLKARFNNAQGDEKTLIAAFIASLVVFFISSFMFDSFGFPQPTYLFFMLLGLSFAISVNNRNDSNDDILDTSKRVKMAR